VSPKAGSAEWLGQVSEDIVDPTQVIIDPHHHLWPAGDRIDYGVDRLVSDTSAGHNIAKTVFVECGAGYRVDVEPTMAPVGETEFVAAVAAELTERFPNAAPIAGIVSRADLRDPGLSVVLDAHEAAGQGLFRGIRQTIGLALEPAALMLPGDAPRGLASDTEFRAGIAELGRRGLTYDSWQYHHQNREFLDLVRASPNTTMVLDHFGTPLGVGQFAGKHDEVFEAWKADIAAIAACENAVAKLGGLAMPDNGFGYHRRERPPTSDQMLADQRRWYEHTIECFGPERCMFESNFPVDKFSAPYTVVWNFFQKLAAQYTPTERDDLFSRTATRVYRL
jgi:L-fuconolactonase